MKLYYINSKGEKLDFSEFPYLVRDISELRNYGHSYRCEGNTISEFYDTICEIPFSINIYHDSRKEYENAANKLFEITEYDIASRKKGKLYYGDQYVHCNLISNKKSDWYEEVGFHVAHINMITDLPKWIIEQHLHINPVSNASEDAEDVKKYSYTYPYRYPPAQARNKFSIDHYTDSHFQMIVYGPAARVQITINGHPYIVEHAIESGEYMVIDSRENLPIGEQLYIVKNNGEKVNVFNYRDSVYSVFKKIPPGNIEIQCSGSYGVDLILFKERSEPKW